MCPISRTRTFASTTRRHRIGCLDCGRALHNASSPPAPTPFIKASKMAGHTGVILPADVIHTRTSPSAHVVATRATPIKARMVKSAGATTTGAKRTSRCGLRTVSTTRTAEGTARAPVPRASCGPVIATRVGAASDAPTQRAATAIPAAPTAVVLRTQAPTPAAATKVGTARRATIQPAVIVLLACMVAPALLQDVSTHVNAKAAGQARIATFVRVRQSTFAVKSTSRSTAERTSRTR